MVRGRRRGRAGGPTASLTELTCSSCRWANRSPAAAEDVLHRGQRRGVGCPSDQGQHAVADQDAAGATGDRHGDSLSLAGQGSSSTLERRLPSDDAAVAVDVRPPLPTPGHPALTARSPDVDRTAAESGPVALHLLRRQADHRAPRMKRRPRVPCHPGRGTRLTDAGTSKWLSRGRPDLPAALRQPIAAARSDRSRTSNPTGAATRPYKLAKRVRFPSPAPRMTAAQVACQVSWRRPGGASGRPA